MSWQNFLSFLTTTATVHLCAFPAMSLQKMNDFTWVICKDTSICSMVIVIGKMIFVQLQFVQFVIHSSINTLQAAL